MSHTSRNASRRQESQFRILIIEDSPDHTIVIQKAIQETFTMAQPVFVASLETALAFLDKCIINPEELPQLVLLDLYCPNREDSIAFLEAIKAQPAPLCQIPVVVFSHSSAEEDITYAYEKGANSYVVKPMNYESWRDYFQALREYWLDVVSLPDQRFTQFL